MARRVMRLLDPPAGGSASTAGDHTAVEGEMRPIRREMMMVFQDPYAWLNPRKRVGFIVAGGAPGHRS